jgi:hypothetical protein
MHLGQGAQIGGVLHGFLPTNGTADQLTEQIVQVPGPLGVAGSLGVRVYGLLS